MPPEVLAVLSAFLFAASHVASKRGVQTTSVIAGLSLSLGTGVVVLLIALLASGASLPAGGALPVLAASGVLAPALARAFAITSIDRLGPTTAIRVQGSVYPLFAVVGALVFLGETVGVRRAAGVVAIMLGVWMLTRDNARSFGARPPLGRAARERGVNLILLLPAAAGLCKGLADLVPQGRAQSVDQCHRSRLHRPIDRPVRVGGGAVAPGGPPQG